MKKVMKALALALALCMVLSVSAFAYEATNKTVVEDTHTVSFTVTGLTPNELVALLVLRDDAELATAGENDILYIDQKAVASDATEVSFTATIAESTEDVDNSVVDIYVGSSTVSASGTAWTAWENVVVAETSSITLDTAKGVEILNVGRVIGEGENAVTITRPGAAIGVNVKGVNISKMIWALECTKTENEIEKTEQKYSNPIAVDLTGIDAPGQTIWFTGVFSSETLKDWTINKVGAIFPGASDSEYYYVGTIDESEIAADKQ